MWPIILDMLLNLMVKDCLTASYFARKHEKSTRTIMRYIDKMRDNGIPIATVRGRNGGFVLSNTVPIKKMFLTEEEIDGIILATRLHLDKKQADAVETKMNLIKGDGKNKR
ncbi:MAG: HTH domain-containing protein [Clostridiales bacterium]|jgi:predicted DNA-binding transcriptional regulator YafY|nr:HTH domain-containing protein [Clostridiales bacterium]